MRQFCCKFNQFDGSMRPRRTSLLTFMVMGLSITGCDLDPFDHDNFNAHGTLDFVDYGQPYHREWDFVLHREGALSVDLGPVDEWSITQAGFLIAGPQGRDLLVDAWMAPQVEGKLPSGQYSHSIWPELAKSRSVAVRIPVALLDNFREPNVITFPPERCDAASQSSVCTASLKLELAHEQLTYRGKLGHQTDRGPDLVRSEMTGALTDGFNHLNWFGLSYVVCPSAKWRNSGLSGQQIALLEKAAISGGKTVTVNWYSSRMQEVCQTLPLGGGWREASVDHYWMEYDGKRLWSVPERPNKLKTLYRADVSAHNTSWSCCFHADKITLRSGTSFEVDPSPNSQAQAVLDRSSDELLIMLQYM